MTLYGIGMVLTFMICSYLFRYKIDQAILAVIIGSVLWPVTWSIVIMKFLGK